MWEEITNIRFQRMVASCDQWSCEVFLLFLIPGEINDESWGLCWAPSTGRGTPLFSPLCVPASVIAVVKWYYSPSPCSVESLSHISSWSNPPFSSFLFIPSRFAPGRQRRDATANEILECFRAGRKSSWKTREREVFLVCLVAELKENGKGGQGGE